VVECAGALLLDGGFEDGEGCYGAEGGQYAVSLEIGVLLGEHLWLIFDYRLKSYCEQVGFWKEKEVSFPHKQSNLMKIRRDSWEQPAL
jgi:hypothetical protein